MSDQVQSTPSPTEEKIPWYRRIRMMTSGLLFGPGFTLGLVIILLADSSAFEWWHLLLAVIFTIYGWGLLYTGFTGRG